MSEWAPHDQRGWWHSGSAHERYWGEDHLDPGYEPDEWGYYLPEVEAYGQSALVTSKPDSAARAHRFAAQWVMWQYHQTLDQRLAKGQHRIPAWNDEACDPTRPYSLIGSFVGAGRVAR